MSRSGNTNYPRRNFEVTSKDIPHARGNARIAEGGSSKREIKERTPPTKTSLETDLLIQEIIQRGIINRVARGTYEISSEICSKIINSMSEIGYAKGALRKAIMNSVLQYYGMPEETPKVRRKVSKIVRLVEKMILEDWL